MLSKFRTNSARVNLLSRRLAPLVISALTMLTASIAWASPAEEKLKLADQCMKDGYFKQAVLFYDQSINLNPNNWRAYMSRGDALMRLGERETARGDYQKALELNPGSPEVLSRLGKHSPSTTSKARSRQARHPRSQ